jgi:hypothetical protein
MGRICFLIEYMMEFYPTGNPGPIPAERACALCLHHQIIKPVTSAEMKLSEQNNTVDVHICQYTPSISPPISRNASIGS